MGLKMIHKMYALNERGKYILGYKSHVCMVMYHLDIQVTAAGKFKNMRHLQYKLMKNNLSLEIDVMSLTLYRNFKFIRRNKKKYISKKLVSSK